MAALHALTLACDIGAAEIVDSLLTQYGADVNAQKKVCIIGTYVLFSCFEYIISMTTCTLHNRKYGSLTLLPIVVIGTLSLHIVAYGCSY